MEKEKREIVRSAEEIQAALKELSARAEYRFLHDALKQWEGVDNPLFFDDKRYFFISKSFDYLENLAKELDEKYKENKLGPFDNQDFYLGLEYALGWVLGKDWDWGIWKATKSLEKPKVGLQV